MALLDWAVSAFADRALADRYARYAGYYDGDHDLAFATAKFASAFGDLFAAFCYNRSAAAVDAHTDRLHVEGFAASDPDHAAEAKAIWDRNRMDTRQGEVYAESLTAGDGYLLVWPDADGRPTLWPQPAANVRVRYDPERPGEVVVAVKRWRTIDERVRLNIYEPDRLRRYATGARDDRTVGPSDKPEAFLPFDEDGFPADLSHDLRVVPIVPFANNARTGELGRSELRAVIPVQDALNKTLMDKMVAMELTAYSQRVILGVDPYQPASYDPLTGTVAIDPATGLPVDPLRVPIQRFQAGIDRILTLSGEHTKIAEFQAVALRQFVEVADFWDTAVSRVSKVPVHYLRMSGGFPSGRALRTAEAPFVAKLEDRQRSFGNAIEDAMTIALRIDGVAEPDGGYGLSTLWRSAAPMSEEDAWDLALQKHAVGMPLRQILLERGYDGDTLETIMGQVAEERAAGEAVEVAALARFAGGAEDGEAGEDG